MRLKKLITISAFVSDSTNQSKQTESFLCECALKKQKQTTSDGSGFQSVVLNTIKKQADSKESQAENTAKRSEAKKKKKQAIESSTFSFPFSRDINFLLNANSRWHYLHTTLETIVLFMTFKSPTTTNSVKRRKTLCETTQS